MADYAEVLKVVMNGTTAATEAQVQAWVAGCQSLFEEEAAIRFEGYANLVMNWSFRVSKTGSTFEAYPKCSWSATITRPVVQVRTDLNNFVDDMWAIMVDRLPLLPGTLVSQHKHTPNAAVKV